MAFVCQSAQHFQAIQDCRNGSDGMPEGEERFEKNSSISWCNRFLRLSRFARSTHRSIRRQSLPGSSRNQFEASRENVPCKRKSAATSRPFRRLLKASALTTSGWWYSIAVATSPLAKGARMASLVFCSAFRSLSDPVEAFWAKQTNASKCNHSWISEEFHTSAPLTEFW